MKTCVFITGTNAVGKSTVAKELIRMHGGIVESNDLYTLCCDGKLSLAGKYAQGKKYGGVDRLKTDNGSSGTKYLEKAVREALKNTDVVTCEGSYMNTFGINLTNALFAAQRQLVVSLYADFKTIYKRLIERNIGGGTGLKGNGANYELIWRKQKQAMIAAKKYQQIGVPVLQYDTSVTSPQQIANDIEKFITE